jgi:hypothetical protein
VVCVVVVVVVLVWPSAALHMLKTMMDTATSAIQVCVTVAPQHGPPIPSLLHHAFKDASVFHVGRFCVLSPAFNNCKVAAIASCECVLSPKEKACGTICR